MLGNIAFLEIYIRCKGSLSIEDQRGRNALHHAVANGHRQFTMMLCEFGIQQNIIEAMDHQGNTALFSSVRYNQESTLKVLMQFNCNMFHRNAKGDTCLHYAALHNA